MAKVYFNKYKRMIDSGEITVAEAIEMAGVDVPEKWRSAVIELLEELQEVEE